MHAVKYATMCVHVCLWQTLQMSCVFAGAPCSLTPLLEPLSPSPWSSVHDPLHVSASQSLYEPSEF